MDILRKQGYNIGVGGGGSGADIKKATYEESTALHNHAIGELIVMIDSNVNTLYKVTSAITAGDTITDEGQNANVTTDTGVSADTQVYVDGLPSAEEVPDGSTVTPTDDVQTLLACAGITDKSYTTLNELLADTTTLQAVIGSENAIDYLVRSTTWASGMCSNQTAMSYVGLNNYASNTLLADSDWLNAICNSTYFESVLNVKVPTMTSNTTPSGVASASSVNENSPTQNDAFHAFNGDTSGSDFWHSSAEHSSCPGEYIGYKFTNPVCVNRAWFKCKDAPTSDLQNFQYKIQGSNDNETWADLTSSLTANVNDYNSLNGITNAISNTNFYLYYRLYFITSNIITSNRCFMAEAQFYGREDV